MPRLNGPHPDDFTLLCYAAGELDQTRRRETASHIGQCLGCRGALKEIELLDRELAALAKDPSSRLDFTLEDLPEGDPFRTRPERARRRPRGHADPDLLARAVSASERGMTLSATILEAARENEEIEKTIAELPLSDPAHRFALLYALQEAGQAITRQPTGFLALARTVIEHLGAEAAGESEAKPLVSPDTLLAQAHLLAGQACLWTAELEQAGIHAATAFRLFATDDITELSLAIVEGLESQRRSFTGRPAEGLTLARRAMLTFQELDVEDHLARAHVAEGLALTRLGRDREAIDSYRKAQPVFQRLGLWSNYVGATNNLATALAKDGALNEARREYARALRRLSRQEHRSLTGFIRQSLGELLFSANRYREAAASMILAAKTYAKSGMPYRALLAWLLEIESWARSGDLARARHRIDLFKAEIQRHPALDPSIARQIAQSLRGENPDLERLSKLREQASQELRQELQRESA